MPLYRYFAYRWIPYIASFTIETGGQKKIHVMQSASSTVMDSNFLASFHYA